MFPIVDFGDRNRRRQKQNGNATSPPTSERKKRRRLTLDDEPKKPFLIGNDDDYSSDPQPDPNIITISSARTQDMTSDEESESDQPIENKETWVARNGSKTNTMRTKITDENKNEESSPKKKRVVRRKRMSHSEVLENHITEPNEKPSNLEIKQPENQTIQSGRLEGKSISDALAEAGIKVRKVPAEPQQIAKLQEYQPNIECPPIAMQSYTVIRHKGAFGKISFNFLNEDKLIYLTELSKDEESDIFIITQKAPIDKQNPTYQGFVRVSGSRKRFSLITKYMKPHDDREGALLGCCFTKNGANLRHVCVVAPLTLMPYYPVSKRTELSHLAKSPERLSSFLYYETDQRNDDTFDSDLVESSIKNFIIKSSKGDVIYRLYKASKDQYNVTSSAPFNTLMAFAIAIAMIFSKK